MQRHLFIRVRWTPFVLLLCCGLFILGRDVSRSFRVALVTPVTSLPPLRRSMPPPVASSHAGWLAVRAFERMMDSLGSCADSGGRRIYDSILAARPGILDSAKTAEGYFLSHDH